MPIEIRYRDLPWGEEVDVVLLLKTDGPYVRVKDLGGDVQIAIEEGSRRVVVGAYTDRMPRQLWWDEVRDAWYDRRWPCFWVTRLVLLEDSP